MSRDTRKAIQNAFLQLAKTKPADKITVREIVELCGVNRNSFYYHFEDLPDLVESSLRESFDQIWKNCPEDAGIEQLVMAVAEEAQKNAFIWQNLASSKNRALLDSRIIRLSWDLIGQWLHRADLAGIAAQEKEMLHYSIHALNCGVLMDWINAGCSYNLPDRLEKLLALRKGCPELIFQNARRLSRGS